MSFDFSNYSTNRTVSSASYGIEQDLDPIIFLIVNPLYKFLLELVHNVQMWLVVNHHTPLMTI